MKKTGIAALCLLIQLTAFSQNNVIPHHQSGTAATLNIQTGLTYCPKSSELRDDTHGFWSARTPLGVWHSHDSSFMKTYVTQFLGAQWTGANVGQVTCIYGSEQRYERSGKQQIQPSLPILLYHESYAIEPHGGEWKRETKEIFNCKSKETNDYPFEIRLKPKAVDIENVIETIKPVGPDDTN